MIFCLKIYGRRYLLQHFTIDIIIIMKPGPKPKGKVYIKWSSEFAYAIGLLVADGCLSKDGRHIDLTSKDLDQLTTFNNCLKINAKISRKFSGHKNLAYRVQFGDVLFYQFLQKIGLSPAKSKTISSVLIPQKYFFDFLRGYFDGDGCSYSFYDSVYAKSYRFYISFASASIEYIKWLRNKLKIYAGVTGHVVFGKKASHIQLKYSKREAVIITEKMYYHEGVLSLKRKKLKINKSLEIINNAVVA